MGDRDIKTEASQSPSDWITPIPREYNSHLISLSKETDDTTFALTISNDSVITETLPESGTNHSIYATFRLIPKDSFPSKVSEPKDFIGELVMLEPFDRPGAVITHKGVDQSPVITDSPNDDSVFRLVDGLDGNKGSVSLEAKSQKGCYLYGDLELFAGVKLKCSSTSSNAAAFREGVSFRLKDGISKYDPISFVAKGVKRNFLLQPLFNIRDENYVVYFNIQSKKD